MDIATVLHYYGFLDANLKYYAPHQKIKCPFHDDVGPSLSVDLERDLWMCFGCGAKGKAVDFIRMMENVSEFQAIRLGLKIMKSPSVVAKEKTAAFYQENNRRDSPLPTEEFFFSLPKHDWANDPEHYMISKRKFNPDTLSHFDVRINPTGSHPVIIPIWDQDNFMGYVSRTTPEENEASKYRYSRGLPKRETVFGRLLAGPVLITEGSFDAMKAWQFGFQNACSILGWSISENQFKKIVDYATVIYCGLDNDESGDKGYERMVKMNEKNFSVPIVRVVYPDGIKDICELDRFLFWQAIGEVRRAASSY